MARRKRYVGRPTDLTPELSKTIIGGFTIGGRPEALAASAGMSSRTIYRWIARGRALIDLVDDLEDSGAVPTPEQKRHIQHDQIYAEFCQEMDQKLANFELKYVNQGLFNLAQVKSRLGLEAIRTIIDRVLKLPAAPKSQYISGPNGGPVETRGTIIIPGMVEALTDSELDAGIERLESVLKGK